MATKFNFCAILPSEFYPVVRGLEWELERKWGGNNSDGEDEEGGWKLS